MATEYVDPRTQRGVWQVAHTRTIGGRVKHFPASRAWSSEDYDLLEKLVEHGLSANEMRRYFTPTPGPLSIANALRRAGIAHGRGRGTPTHQERARWDILFQRWQRGEL